MVCHSEGSIVVLAGWNHPVRSAKPTPTVTVTRRWTVDPRNPVRIPTAPPSHERAEGYPAPWSPEPRATAGPARLENHDFVRWSPNLTDEVARKSIPLRVGRLLRGRRNCANRLDANLYLCSSDESLDRYLTRHAPDWDRSGSVVSSVGIVSVAWFTSTCWPRDQVPASYKHASWR
jgi:hypothetical protein